MSAAAAVRQNWSPAAVGFGGVEHPPVAQQHAQRQVPADQIRQVAVDLVGVDLVDDVGDQHDQRPLAAVRGQVAERLVVARFGQLREAVERWRAAGGSSGSCRRSGGTKP